MAAAFARAVQLRQLGMAHLAVPLLADLPTAYVRRRALGAIANGNLQAQQAALEQLAAQSRAPEIINMTPELVRTAGTLRALYDFVMTADGVLVRSLAEMVRLKALVPAATLQRLCVLTGPAALTIAPATASHMRDMVLVWAPQLDAAALGIETFALATSGRRCAIVCRSGKLDGIDVAFGHLADAPQLVQRSRAIIIADSCDPAPAVAFAAAGYSVIAAHTSGAIEQLDGVVEYDPCSVTSLAQAIVTAWDSPAPSIRSLNANATGPHYAVPEDARCTATRQLGATAWQIDATYDLRRDAFDRLANGVARLPSAAPIDPETAGRHLAAGTLLRFESWRGVARMREQLGLRLCRIAVQPERDPSVPTDLPAKRSRDAVVVWAPALRAAEVATIVMGLHYEKRPVIVVCNGGELPGSSVTIVGIDRAASALARALVCVDADTRSPAAALGLAALDIPLVVASTSGADEYLDFVTVYDPWDHVSIFSAVAIAKASGSPIVPRRIEAAQLADRLATYGRDIALDGPLVSVVLLTRNRRNFLTRAIASVARQQYRNIETIVVRNGGVRVDDIVGNLPGGRVLDSEINLGVNEGFNLGTRAARGTYIAYLADDDEFLPEHIGSAVAALTRTGSAFAHGGMLAVHLVPDGSGGYSASGYGVACERPAEPAFMRAMNSVATPAMLMSRELLAQTGDWDESLGPMADYELVMRFMLLDELVYVNRPLVVQTYRRDATQYSAKTNPDMPGILRSLYARHPLGDEPWAARARTQWVANFERHQAGGSSTPLWYPAPTVTFPPQPYSAAEAPELAASVP